MRFAPIVLGALLWCVGGCSTGDTTGATTMQQPPPQPLTPALMLSSGEGGLETGAVSRAFNFGQLREIWVRATVPVMQHVTMVNVTFRNPMGELIYESNVGYTSDAKMTTMPMGGNAAPMSLGHAKPIPGGFAIDMGFPVGGTVFTRFPTSGVGDWTVQARVDGVDHVLTTSMSVVYTR